MKNLKTQLAVLFPSTLFRTKAIEPRALAELAPAGKPDHANSQESLCRTDQNPRGCRSRSTHSSQRSGLLWLACAVLAMGLASAHAQGPSETVLHAFGNLRKGANPAAGVIRDTAGNLYGTTSGGGASGAGVVFKVDAAGEEKVLYSFTGGADGGYPEAGVLRDAAGNLYGTTSGGGSGVGYAGAGVVFKVDTAGQETVLYTFTGGADGSQPYAGVIRDVAGNLYGTTSGGGASGAGVVFMVDAAGEEKVLYSFTGGADGGYPYAGLIRDVAGNLYGSATGGGASGAGVVFKVNTAGQETALYTFTGGNDGGYPYSTLIADAIGNLYGTASGGGASSAGVVFKVGPTGLETVLYAFTGGNDGGYPFAGVIGDALGNLYGSTFLGGTAGAGVVFELSTVGQETALYSFTGGVDGGYLEAGVIRDPAGNLYGTSYNGGPGGSNGYGLVFKVNAAGQYSAAYTFPPPADGALPYAGVIRDSRGNLYGTTSLGGVANAGVVYKVNPTGRQTVLYAFTGGADGSNPQGGVVRDSRGHLYGTTPYGGSGAGVVFELNKSGQETVLYTFTGGADGRTPFAGLISDKAGNLYGTTTYGGTSGKGVVFKLAPPAQLGGTWTETVLYNFTGGADGGNPYGAGVILDAAGNLYGTTTFGGVDFYGYPGGVAYSVNPSGQETVLYNFCGLTHCTDGVYPGAGVILDSVGNLYGTTEDGGADNGDCNGAGCGVVFKLNPSGQETVLHTFTGGADGGEQYYGYFSAGVILDSAGNLYGTTYLGGSATGVFCGGAERGCGVVFTLNPSGQETVLYSFTGGADGGNPFAGVILDSVGNLYGTTYDGGKYNGGVVYELEPQ